MKKPKHAFTRLLIGSLILFFGVSCKKQHETESPASSGPNAALIAEAKIYFESSKFKNDSVKSSSINTRKTARQRLNKSLKWDKALTEVVSKGEIVKVPVYYDSNIQLTYQGATWNLSSLTQAFIYKNKLGAISVELVTRIPDHSSASSTFFSGLVIVEDWYGHSLKCFKFKNGKATLLGVPEETNAANQNVAVNTIKTNDFTCQTFTWGTCAYNGSTGESYGCHQDGSEIICYGQTSNGDYINDDAGDYSGGGGGGTGTTTSSFSDSDIGNALPYIENSEKINPNLFINCFTDGKTASAYRLTMYVDQPVQGSNDQWSLTSYGGVRYQTPSGVTFNVGHTFVGFEKLNTDGSSVIQVMGFYPQSASTNTKGVIKDDGGHGYSVSYTATVSADQFNLALHQLSEDSGNSNYILSDVNGGAEYNCTDAAITWMADANVSLPAFSGRGFFSNSPGDYGQALRGQSGANTIPGYSPVSHGPCN